MGLYTKLMIKVITSLNIANLCKNDKNKVLRLIELLEDDIRSIKEAL